MKISATLTGTKAIVTKLTEIERRARKVVRKAVDKAATIQLRAARGALRSKRTGLLGKSLGKKVSMYPNGTAVSVVGPRRGFKVTLRSVERKGRRETLIATRTVKGKQKQIKLRATPQIKAALARGENIRLDATTYAHLVEGGAKPHAIGKGSSLRKKLQSGKQHPGARADRFLARAQAATAAQVRAVINAHIAAHLTKGGGE